MIGRILLKIFSAEVMGLILVITALQTFTYGVASSLRNTDTRYFFLICLIAAWLAWASNKRKLKGAYVAVAMFALGVIGVWILGARLAMPLMDLARSIGLVIPDIIPAIRSHAPIDTTGIAEAWLVVVQASQALSLRLQTWSMSFTRDVTVNDALVRNMIWMLIMWVLSAWMGWYAARRNAMAALLPSVLLLAAITSYSEHKVETLWLMVFILLLLLGVWNYRNHAVQWETKKVDYSDSIRYDVSQAVVLLTLTIGVIAFITPSISWKEIRDYLRERNQNEIAETLGVQQQQVVAQNVPSQKPSLPREHLLTGGFAQSQDIVMIIRTGELPPVVNPVITTEAPRYYWRSVTYDMYVGAGWVTSGAVPQRVQPNTPLIPGLLNGYKPLHLDVEMIEPEGKLFWSGILFSADIPLRVDWRVRPQSSLFADQSTLLEADMFAAATNTRGYRAESYLPITNIEDLRQASVDYPEEIRDRYLKLPRSVPERVYQLARDITRDKQTAYDKAKAIESYLRTTYPYDLEVPAPPEDKDVADYFLFELKKGYCDYYATAMVVLARASGLPARFVSGYSPGSYDAANAQYIVRELNAHSWAEVYFPEVGWIEFEPTAAQPEIVRDLSRSDVPEVTKRDSIAAELLYRFRLETAIYWLSPFVIILFIVLIYFGLIEGWWYLHFAPVTAIEKIYRRLYRMGRPLAGTRTRAETAHEFMQKLVKRIDSISEGSRFRKMLFSAQRDIASLTDVYQSSLFSESNVQRQDARNALRTWRHLRLRLWVARINAYVQNVFRRRRSLQEKHFESSSS